MLAAGDDGSGGESRTISSGRADGEKSREKVRIARVPADSVLSSASSRRSHRHGSDGDDEAAPTLINLAHSCASIYACATLITDVEQKAGQPRIAILGLIGEEHPEK